MMKRILIVDDEKVIRSALSRILESTGFYTESSENGKDALKKLKSTSFDLVLLDILMPEMDGLQFMQKLIKMEGSPPVLIISACHDDSLIEKTRELGAHGYLKKPFDNLEELLTTIRKVFSE